MASRSIKFEQQNYDVTYLFDADKGKWILQPKTPVEGRSQMTSRKATLADIGKVVRGKRAWDEFQGKANEIVSGVLVHFIDTIPPMAIVRWSTNSYLTAIYDAVIETPEPSPRYRDMIPDDLDAGERYGQVSNDRVTWHDALILGHHRAAAFAWSASVLVKNIPTNQLYLYARIKVN
jgi:hypothetical protein